jgi:hypothetical protein
MYYLQSRYYDPEICRFINADNTTYLGAGIPTLTDSGRFAEGMTAFAGTLFSGTQTELVNAFIS